MSEGRESATCRRSRAAAEGELVCGILARKGREVRFAIVDFQVVVHAFGRKGNRPKSFD